MMINYTFVLKYVLLGLFFYLVNQLHDGGSGLIFIDGPDVKFLSVG